MIDAQQSDNQIRSLLTNAEIHFNRGEWDQADACFDRVLEMNPQNKVALSGRRDVREKREREAEIQSKLKEGRDHLEALRFKEAIAAFNAAQDVGASHNILIYHAEIRTLRDRAQDALAWRTAVDDGMAKARQAETGMQAEAAIAILRGLQHSLTANGQEELAEPVRAELARLVQTREVEEQIDEAQQAFEEQDLERASKIAQELEQRYGDRADVKRNAANFTRRWMMLNEQLQQAQTYLNEGKLEDAVAMIAKVRGMVPKNPNWQALWLRAYSDQGHSLMAQARAALVQQDFSAVGKLIDAAAAAFTAVLDVFPGHQPSERALAEMKAWGPLTTALLQVRRDELALQWDAALGMLEQASGYVGAARAIHDKEAGSKVYADVEGMLKSVEARILAARQRINEARTALGDAEEAMAQHRIDRAIEYYLRGLEVLGDLPEDALQNELRMRHRKAVAQSEIMRANTDRILDEVRGHARRGDWESALEKLNEARTLDINPSEIEREVQRINRQRQIWVEIGKHQLDAEQKRATNSRLDAKRSYDEAILLASYPDSGLEPELRSALSDLRSHFTTMLDPYVFTRQGAELISEAHAKLDRIVRSGSKNPLTDRLSALARDWYDISVAHARFGYVSSAEAIGSLEDAYAVAKEQLRYTPDDSEIVQKVIELRSKILEHLHGSITKRITRAEYNASHGSLGRALEDITSVERIVAPIQAKFPEIGDDKTIQQQLQRAEIMETQFTRLEQRAKQLDPLVEQINLAYVNGQLSGAERLINEAEVIDPERSAKSLWDQIDSLRKLIRRRHQAGTVEKLDDLLMLVRVRMETDESISLDRLQTEVMSPLEQHLTSVSELDKDLWGDRQQEFEYLLVRARERYRNLQESELSWQTAQERIAAEAWEDAFKVLERGQSLSRGQMRENIQREIERIKPLAEIQRKRREAIENGKRSLSMRRFTDAIDNFASAIQLDAPRAEIQPYLAAAQAGEYLERAGAQAVTNPNEAVRLLTDAIQLAGEASPALELRREAEANLAVIIQRLEHAANFAKMLQVVEAALAKDQIQSASDALDAIMQSDQGHPSVQDLKRKVNEAGRAQALLTGASALYEEERYREAIELVERSLAIYPLTAAQKLAARLHAEQDAGEALARAQSLAFEGHFAEARREFESARDKNPIHPRLPETQQVLKDLEEQHFVRVRRPIEDAYRRRNYSEALHASKQSLPYLELPEWKRFLEGRRQNILDEWMRHVLQDARLVLDKQSDGEIGQLLESAIATLQEVLSFRDELTDTMQQQLTEALSRVQKTRLVLEKWDAIQPSSRRAVSAAIEEINAQPLMQSIEPNAICDFLQIMTTTLGIPASELDVTSIWPESTLDLSPILGYLKPAGRNDVFTSIVPAIFLHPGCVQQVDFPELIDSALSVKAIRRAGLIFLFSLEEYHEHLDNIRHRIAARVRETGRDAVVFYRHDITQILTAEEPQRQLRLFILSQIDIRRISPYNTSGRTPDHVFVGRELEIREVSENCTETSFALIGGRRIGKTSMLRRLHQHYFAHVGLFSMYYDCSQVHDLEQFLSLNIDNLAWSPDLPTDAPRSFRQLLGMQRRRSPILVLLDEADQLVVADRAAKSESWPLFKTLRAVSNNGLAQFIFSGERSLRDAIQDSSSPLFNFVNVRFLGPLDYLAVEQLILGPMKRLEIQFAEETEITQRIFAFTSGHPNIVQFLCARLLERLNYERRRRLDLGDVDAILNDPQFVRVEFLGTYFSSATVLEHLVALLMAQNPDLGSLTSVFAALNETDIHTTLNQVDGALERLVDLRNILRRTSDGYEFAIPAFPALIAKYRRIEDMINLRAEIYKLHGDILPEHAPRDERGNLW